MSSKEETLIIRLNRKKQLGETTLSKLTIDGLNKSWFVLEPAGPDSNISNSDKRIFCGTYKVKPYSSPKYPNVYEIKNVPGRSYILIHAGNYHEDTLGCLMPGKSSGILSGNQYYVSHSKAALKEIFSELKKHSNIEIKISNQLEE